MVPSGVVPSLSRHPRPPSSPPSWYPSSDDELLLRAAMHPDDRAGRAWTDVRPRIDIDRMNYQQLALLPLIARSLTAIQLSEPELPRMHGLRRHTWVRNQQLFARVRPVVESLAAAGIQSMALKGAPLALDYYGDVGLRPMNDIDLLVQFNHFAKAVEIVEAGGFAGPAITEPSLRYFHSRESRGADGVEIDLHWLVHESFGLRGVPRAWWSDFWNTDIAPDEMWSRAVHVTARDEPFVLPCASDLLLHVLVHGVGDNSGATLRWITDAVTILESPHHTVDWDLVVAHARRRGAMLALRDTLDYLDSSGFAHIPATVLTAARGHVPTWREQMVYNERGRPEAPPGRLRGARWVARVFTRATVHESLPTALVALPAFLARDATSPIQVPKRLAQRVGTGIGRAVVGSHR